MWSAGLGDPCNAKWPAGRSTTRILNAGTKSSLERIMQALTGPCATDGRHQHCSWLDPTRRLSTTGVRDLSPSATRGRHGYAHPSCRARRRGMVVGLRSLARVSPGWVLCWWTLATERWPSCFRLFQVASMSAPERARWLRHWVSSTIVGRASLWAIDPARRSADH